MPEHLPKWSKKYTEPNPKKSKLFIYTRSCVTNKILPYYMRISPWRLSLFQSNKCWIETQGKKLRSSLRLKTPATLHAKLEIMFDFQKYTFRGSIWKLAMLNLREIFKRWSDWPGNLRSLRFAPRCFGIRIGVPPKNPNPFIIRGSMRNPNHQTPQTTNIHQLPEDCGAVPSIIFWCMEINHGPDSKVALGYPAWTRQGDACVRRFGKQTGVATRWRPRSPVISRGP